MFNPMTSEINEEVHLMADTVAELSEKLNDHQAAEEDEQEGLGATSQERKLATFTIRQLKAAQSHLNKVKIILQDISRANS